MNIVVLGSGALGSYIGAILCQKYNITLIGRKEHINAIRKNGLVIFGRTNLRVYPKTSFHISEVKDIELLILTTKSYDTESAMKSAKRYLNKKTIILSIQNGIGNYEKIYKITRRKAIIGLYFGGITLTEYGKIFHAGIGELVLGEYNKKITKRIKEVEKIFPLQKRISKNIKGEIWAKAIVNSCINPLTAIFRVKNGTLLKNKKLKNLMEEICKEGIVVANKSNISLPYDVLKKARETVLLTAKNKSSMLQDIEKRKRTEIDEINGEIVRQGKKIGIKIEINEKVIEAVKEIENRITWDYNGKFTANVE